jgi:hypothetical protein
MAATRSLQSAEEYNVQFSEKPSDLNRVAVEVEGKGKEQVHRTTLRWRR